jgi:hypothetical protein
MRPTDWTPEELTEVERIKRLAGTRADDVEARAQEEWTPAGWITRLEVINETTGKPVTFHVSGPYATREEAEALGVYLLTGGEA